MVLLPPVRVLYMEDNEGAARLFKMRLERLGYEVDLASNGEEGLVMQREGDYDVLAVDQRMPVYDGVEVIRILKEEGRLPPTIMITGAGNEKVAVEALKLGAGDYIVKDVDGVYLELLPAVIDQQLQQQRLIQERREALEALEQHNRNLEKLNHLGQALTATLDFDAVIEKVLLAAQEITDSECSSVWIRSGFDEHLLIGQATCFQGEYYLPTNLTLHLSEGTAGWVVTNDVSAIILSESNDPRLLPDLYARVDLYRGPVNWVLAVPMRVRGRVIGVLEIVNKRGHVFDNNDLILAETLAASAAIAIDNARLVDELRSQALDLSSRNEELDAFSHMVAHDLKNPLSLIIGYAQFLRKRRSSGFDEEIFTCLQQIEQSGAKMSNIIDELLLLAKIRGVEVERTPLDMGDIVAMAEFRLTHMIKESDAQIVWPDAWPVALGQEAWIEEVWVNYLSNAIKYGGQPPCLELGATDLGNGTIRFWIRDNGQGLTPEQQGRLFTPFTRLNQVRAQGHGLGLSIVKRIVEKLGGEVGVESEEGKGSTFSFTLPAPQN
jgi:signal transduction histidine kinase/DNA-binding response OmpR family regulator